MVVKADDDSYVDLYAALALARSHIHTQDYRSPRILEFYSNLSFFNLLFPSFLLFSPSTKLLYSLAPGRATGSWVL